jgi:serine/threonine-protein kinase RsbW
MSTARPLRRTFPGEPGQVATVRNFVGRYLAGRRCPAAMVQDILVCVSELATNAVLHSRSGLPGGHFSVGVAICGAHGGQGGHGGQGVCVVVEDAGGPWSGHGTTDRDAEHGRGLHVVAELSDDMGVTGDAVGRTAWFRCRWTATKAD